MTKKISTSKTEYDQDSTLHKELEIEIFLALVTFLAMPTCKLREGTLLSATVMHWTACLTDTKEETSLIFEGHLKSH